jgi:hypothetical protein
MSGDPEHSDAESAIDQAKEALKALEAGAGWTSGRFRHYRIALDRSVPWLTDATATVTSI